MIVTVYTTVDQWSNSMTLLWLPYAPKSVEKPLREAHAFVFQQIRERIEAMVIKGILSDHWS